MIDRCIIYFIILSFIGYIYESIAMTFWGGKWDNRGFLFGPIIPIYGFGALGGTLFFRYVMTGYTPLQVFLIGVFASAVLEYSVHYAMEQLFHAYWWDYSKAPLNLNGRICLPASIGFGLAGLVIVYVINPWLVPWIDKLPGTLTEVLAILLTFLFTVDLTLTVTIVSGFENRVEAMDNFINEHMDDLVSNYLDESKGWNNKFYSAVDRLEEGRKRLISDRIEKTVNSMNGIYHETLSRIKGYRGKNASRLNYMLKRIKHKIGRNKDE